MMEGSVPQGNYAQFPPGQGADTKRPGGEVDHNTADFLRFSTIVTSLISFSCIASIKDYGKQSALGFACVAAVILWVYSMGMLCVETYVYRLRTYIMPEHTLQNYTRMADWFMLFFTYTATVAISVISVDMGNLNNKDLVHAGAIFLWFSSICIFSLIFYREDGMSHFASEPATGNSSPYAGMQDGVGSDPEAYSGGAVAQASAEAPPSADL